jgi:hypothetical protein
MILSTHSDRLERYLGHEQVENISRSMNGWYGPPIAVGNAPGAVWACGDGDFRGRLAAGQMTSLQDYVEQRIKRILRNASRRQLSSLNAGFSSMSDLIAEATTGGKKRSFLFNKLGVAADAAGASVSLWGLGNTPAAGANAANAPGGEAPTDATTGAFPFSNPTGGDTQHLVGAQFSGDAATRTLFLYDRIFQVNKTMNSTATEAVTGVPTRYQSSTPGNADYAGGNFIFPEVGVTLLPATAHNHTVLQYRNQAGTDAQVAPSAAGVSGMNARGIDLAIGQWFMPLAAGDTGAMDLAQIQLDALVATGVLNYIIGHPIAFFAIPVADVLHNYDGIMTAFNLTRIFDDAALALSSLGQSATTATVFNGHFETVAG